VRRPTAAASTSQVAARLPILSCRGQPAGHWGSESVPQHCRGVGCKSCKCETSEGSNPQVGGGSAKSWTALPSLTKARWVHATMDVQVVHPRAKHGCAIVTDGAGRTGLLVAGGTGDKVRPCAVGRLTTGPSRSRWPPLQSSLTWATPAPSGRHCPTSPPRGVAGRRSVCKEQVVEIPHC
jgi:hypothetical protein